MVVALVAGAAVIGAATSASAATSYSVVATVDTGSALADGLAVDPEHDSVYVVNPSANRVSVIDTTSNTVKTTIPVGAAPFRVALDPGLDRAYVTNTNGNSMSVIDTNTNTVVSTISSPRFIAPRGVAVDPTTHKVHVAIYLENQMLAVVDPTTSPATFEYTDILDSRPWAVDVDPTTHRAYPTTLFGGTLSTVSGTTILSTIRAFGGPTQVTVDPTTKLAYVANAGNLSVVDISTVTPVVTGTLAPGTQHSDLAIDDGAGTFYVTNYANASASVIDKTSGAVVATVPVGDHPSAVEVDPVSHRAYVVNNDHTVSVIAPFASQDITFTSDAPGAAAVGDSYTATATGGGSGNPVTFSTASHACMVTSGGQVAFTHVGECVVAADQEGSSTYTDAPTATQAVEVDQAAQDITFTSQAPSDATVGDSYVVSATGGDSAEPVTFSVDPATTNAACSIAGSTVSFDHAGSCVVAADQGGTTDYAAAPTATQQLAVDLDPTTTAVTLPTSGVVSGQAATATATVSGTHDGSVQFTLDGTPVGSPVVPAQDGTATSPDLVGPGLAVGSHPVGARFTPTDGDTYAASTATPQTLTVSKAATTSSVSVDANHVTAGVTPTAPGAGHPSGTVRFYLAGSVIGRAALTGGTATLPYQVPTGSTRQVSAVYAGDAAFTGSSASTARRDPVVSATVSSAQARRHRWYASPVTVTFHCRATSAALTEACPAPVTLSRNAAGQSVTRTVVATDGGAATVAVRDINIDRVRPVARVTGVRAGATYFAAGPVAGCRASDGLSGVAACTVTRTTRRHQVVYVATATDRAGNRSSTRLVARTTPVAVSGASMRDGHYVVHRGHTYTVLVAATKRPRYTYAAPSPHRPAGRGPLFQRTGRNRWALGVTFTQSMSHHTWWNIGTRVGTRTTVTTVRVVR